MRLFHFSEDPDIRRFVPRAVRVPSARPPGREWLNGPLVWAIDDWHAPLYLFPRDCPRILVWPTERTTDADRAAWFAGRPSRMIAHVEEAWRDRLGRAAIYRYEFPLAAFENLHDAGMWVCRVPVEPLGMEVIADLPAALAANDVELRILDSLTPLRDVWSTSLHASGVRLRNAMGWAETAN